MPQRGLLIPLLVSLFVLGISGETKNQEKLSPHLTPLKSFIGKTWKGEFKGSTQNKPMFDVSRWERVLNGQAIRVLHSVNDGEYGGESMIFWEPKKESIVYYYFTTAGFYTNGTVTIENGKFKSHEFVTGEESGITEVEGTSEILPDGRLHSKSQYLKNGEWVVGHEVIYREDSKAKVNFK